MTRALQPERLAEAPWLRSPETARLLEALTSKGGEARFVGGCVRDTLLDPSLDDLDLDVATQETPARNLELLAAAGIKTVPTGLKHGTITALIGPRAYEVTTLRRDVSTDGRHAEVAFARDFEADAARRDLTINALYCDAGGRVWDFFGGLEDLERGAVRFVGNPATRIAEDYLRILRFFRFHARFGCGEPDAAAMAAIRELAPGIKRLSGERRRQELFKLLALPKAPEALGFMHEAGVLEATLAARVDVARSAALIERITNEPEAPPDPLLALAGLVRGHAEPKAVAETLKLSNAEAKRLAALCSTPLPDLEAGHKRHRREAYRLGVALHRDLLRLAAAERREAAADDALIEALAALECFDPPPLPVGGNDLTALGLRGPEVGRALARLHDAWADSGFSASKDELLDLVRP